MHAMGRKCGMTIGGKKQKQWRVGSNFGRVTMTNPYRQFTPVTLLTYYDEN